MPLRLAEATYRSTLWEASAERVLFRFPTVGRFLATAGDETIQVQAAAGAGDEDVEAFVAGPVGAAAGLLSGRLSLKGAALEHEGSAVLILGPPSTGKSSLAAALAQSGLGLLADQAVHFDHTSNRVQLGRPEIPLTRVVAAELGLSEDAGRRWRPGVERRVYQFQGAVKPVPPGWLLWLSLERPRSNDTDTVKGTEKLARIQSAAWHRPLIRPMGLQLTAFRWATALAQLGHIRVVRRGASETPSALAERCLGIVR